ncbi:unnamed protein product [Menidia menidia]|uniref:(Atlantic silverside) hypothetical protein n=1 Tax=Menidia menidia TaxID=238744 RepID=A0A8S4BRW7_9TELE|nr:unnamed protein product [Menidia menidia]
MEQVRVVTDSCGKFAPEKLSVSITIGRTLIPRYFSTVFEGGVTELHYILKHSKESFHNSCITLDCDQCTMVTQHGKPIPDWSARGGRGSPGVGLKGVDKVTRGANLCKHPPPGTPTLPLRAQRALRSLTGFSCLGARKVFRHREKTSDWSPVTRTEPSEPTHTGQGTQRPLGPEWKCRGGGAFAQIGTPCHLAQDPQVLEQLSKNITRMGLTNFTLNYLRG